MSGAFAIRTNAPNTASGSVVSGTVVVDQPFPMKDTAATVFAVTDGKPFTTRLVRHVSGTFAHFSP